MTTTTPCPALHILRGTMGTRQPECEPCRDRTCQVCTPGRCRHCNASVTR